MTSSLFLATEIDEAIRRRCVEGDVHPTGPLWGAGDPLSAGAVTERETEVLAGFSAWREGLAAQGLSQERRALRVVPRELSYDPQVNLCWTSGSFCPLEAMPPRSCERCSTTRTNGARFSADS